MTKRQYHSLMSEPAVMLYPTLATLLGVNQAAILQKLDFLLHSTEQDERMANFINDSWWVYNSYPDWRRKYFPWLSVSAIKGFFLQLENMGIVVSFQPGTSRGVQTKWYRIDYDVWYSIEPTMRQILSGGSWDKKYLVMGQILSDQEWTEFVRSKERVQESPKDILSETPFQGDDPIISEIDESISAKERTLIQSAKLPHATQRLSAIDSDDRINADSDPSEGERADNDAIHSASNSPTPSAAAPLPAIASPFKTISHRPSGIQSNKPIVEGYVPPKGRGQHDVAVNPPQSPVSTSKPVKAKKPSIITSIDEINEIDRPLYKFICSVKGVDPVMDYNDKELQQYTFVLIGAIVNREKAALKITEGVLDLKSRTSIALRLSDPVTGFVAWYSKMSPGMNLPTGKVTFKTNFLKWYDQTTAMISKSEPEFVTITVMSDWGAKIDKRVLRADVHKYTQVER